MRNVTFDKGTNPTHSARRVYRSKCGRFIIERWEFDIPTRSVDFSYRVREVLG